MSPTIERRSNSRISIPFRPFSFSFLRFLRIYTYFLLNNGFVELVEEEIWHYLLILDERTILLSYLTVLQDSYIVWCHNFYMSKKKIIIIGTSSLCVLLIAATIGLLVSGAKYGIPPFGFLRDERLKKLEGNDEKYSLKNIDELDNSPLEGMNVAYLGSSVTYGASSLGTSFVEYISKRNKTTYIKEAVSGTTLADHGNSYIKRIKDIDKGAKIDLFVCQLSTNDASQNNELGKVNDLDVTTTCGAINYIIDYVKETWDCPLMFYTNSYYENSNYQKMVDSLKEIVSSKDVGLIDLYSDQEFNNITTEKRALYMEDNIHPTKAGYLEWWTPRMEKDIYEFVGKKQ